MNKTLKIENIKKVKIYNSNTKLSDNDINNMMVEVSEDEIIQAIVEFYTDKYHKLIDKLFYAENYEQSDGDKEKIAIAILSSILKDESYDLTDTDKLLIKACISLFKDMTREKYY